MPWSIKTNDLKWNGFYFIKQEWFHAVKFFIMKDPREKLGKAIRVARRNAGKVKGKTPLENITESLDNSPIWPVAASQINQEVQKSRAKRTAPARAAGPNKSSR
jgi:hypothetical protein